MPSITRTDLREELEEVLDLHSATYHELMLEKGVDAYWFGKYWTPKYDFYAIKASEVWTEEGLVNREGWQGVLVRTRKAYLYPVLTVKTKLPTWTGKPQSCFFGLEVGGDTGAGIAAFEFGVREDGSEYLQADCGGGWQPVVSDLTWILPADAKAKLHKYTIVVTETWVEFYIDVELVAIALNAWNNMNPKISGPPYSIFFTAYSPMAQRLPALLEIIGGGLEAKFPITCGGVSVTDGTPRPPRTFIMRKEGTYTWLPGYSLSSGSVTSHPVPILGREGKTIYFMADKDGTLSIEVMTANGNWREYDSASITAGKLLSYTMAGEAPLVRVTFTPSSYPATILEAEVVVR